MRRFFDWFRRSLVCHLSEVHSSRSEPCTQSKDPSHSCQPYSKGIFATMSAQPRRSLRGPTQPPHYFAAVAANTSRSSVAVVPASRLSLTSTVSPCSSITTGPSSVDHACRPFRGTTLNTLCFAGASLAPAASAPDFTPADSPELDFPDADGPAVAPPAASPTSSAFLYRFARDRA